MLKGGSSNEEIRRRNLRAWHLPGRCRRKRVHRRGAGFGTPCAQGGCPLFNGSVNAIGTNSLDLFQSAIFQKLRSMA